MQPLGFEPSRRATGRGLAAFAALLAAGAVAGGCDTSDAPSQPSGDAQAKAKGLTERLNTTAGELTATGENKASVLKAALGQDDWGWPVDATDCSADPEGCDKGAKKPGIYRPTPKASSEYELCLLVPYLDPYWLAVNYGASVEARRHGAKLTLQSAGGYENLAEQINQLNNCVARGADAILLAAVSADGLNAQVDQAVDQGVPVIDVANGITAESVSAHAAVTYRTLGRMVGEYLAGKGQPIKLAWFPGPAGASWAEVSTVGAKEGIEDSEVKLVATKYAPTDKASQQAVVENTLEAIPDVDYMGGASVALEAGVPLLENRGLSDQVSLVADYVVPETLKLIRAGRIECASSDTPVVIARIAVDQAIRLLEKQPMVSGSERERIEPRPFMVCGEAAGEASNVDDVPVDAMIAPEGFKPTS